MKYTILFALLKDRLQPGKASIVDVNGNVALGPWPCLGCCDSVAAAQHGNPTSDPLKPWGNTPTGDYGIATLLAHGGAEQNLHSYGPFQTLSLIGVAGDALTATGSSKPVRTGIEAHAGDPSPSGGLRVTHGCLRSSNLDQSLMITFVRSKLIGNFIVRVTES